MTGQLPTNIKESFIPDRKYCPKCQPRHWFPNQYKFCPYCATKLIQNEETIYIHKLEAVKYTDSLSIQDTRKFENKIPDTDRLI